MYCPAEMRCLMHFSCNPPVIGNNFAHRAGLDTLLRNRGVGPAVAVQSRCPASEVLPSLYSDIDILRLNLNQASLPSRLFARDHCRSRSAHRVEHHIAPPAAVADGAFHQLHRLHGGMQIVDLRLVHMPDIALVAGATPIVITTFTPAVEQHLKSSLIIRSAKRERVLTPNAERGPMATGVGESFVQGMEF